MGGGNVKALRAKAEMENKGPSMKMLERLFLFDAQNDCKRGEGKIKVCLLFVHTSYMEGHQTVRGGGLAGG